MNYQEMKIEQWTSMSVEFEKVGQGGSPILTFGSETPVSQKQRDEIVNENVDDDFCKTF